MFSHLAALAALASRSAALAAARPLPVLRLPRLRGEPGLGGEGALAAESVPHRSRGLPARRQDAARRGPSAHPRAALLRGQAEVRADGGLPLLSSERACGRPSPCIGRPA